MFIVDVVFLSEEDDDGIGTLILACIKAAAEFRVPCPRPATRHLERAERMEIIFIATVVVVVVVVEV